MMGEKALKKDLLALFVLLLFLLAIPPPCLTKERGETPPTPPPTTLEAVIPPHAYPGGLLLLTVTSQQSGQLRLPAEGVSVRIEGGKGKTAGGEEKAGSEQEKVTDKEGKALLRVPDDVQDPLKVTVRKGEEHLELQIPLAALPSTAPGAVGPEPGSVSIEAPPLIQTMRRVTIKGIGFPTDPSEVTLKVNGTPAPISAGASAKDLSQSLLIVETGTFSPGPATFLVQTQKGEATGSGRAVTLRPSLSSHVIRKGQSGEFSMEVIGLAPGQEAVIEIKNLKPGTAKIGGGDTTLTLTTKEHRGTVPYEGVSPGPFSFLANVVQLVGQTQQERIESLENEIKELEQSLTRAEHSLMENSVGKASKLLEEAEAGLSPLVSQEEALKKELSTLKQELTAKEGELGQARRTGLMDVKSRETVASIQRTLRELKEKRKRDEEELLSVTKRKEGALKDVALLRSRYDEARKDEKALQEFEALQGEVKTVRDKLEEARKALEEAKSKGSM